MKSSQSEMRDNKQGVVFGRQYGTKNETAMAAMIINEVEGFPEGKAVDTKRFKVVSITNEQVK